MHNKGGSFEIVGGKRKPITPARRAELMEKKSTKAEQDSSAVDTGSSSGSDKSSGGKSTKEK